ncbi:hypothetical protein [Streptomyces sp. NPDC007088]|uniref:hypothetical protein n=1 Tax=Streptomyces sp. NPDC007088 TaxID=3364773 RepID=UPI0036C58F76
MKLNSRRIRTGIAVGAMASAAVVWAVGPAAALTVYKEHARAAAGPPDSTSKAPCVTVLNEKHQTGAQGCFEKYGDVFWIKDRAADGHHVEMSGTTNSQEGKVGFRCWEDGGSAAGWQKCTSFSGKIPETSTERVIYTVAIYEGSKYINGITQISATK